MDITQTDILKIVQASENIVCENITNAFYNQELVIISIILKNDYPNKIDFKLPNTLRKLIFGDKTHGFIQLPNSLKLLHMRYYCEPIILPKNLEILYIDIGNVHKMQLPDRLICIVLFCQNYTHKNSMYLDNFPDSIKTIHVSYECLCLHQWINMPRSVKSFVVYNIHNKLISSHKLLTDRIILTNPNAEVCRLNSTLLNCGKLVPAHLNFR